MRTATFAATALVIVGVLAGCGGQVNSPGAGAQSPQATTAAAAPTSTNATSASAAAAPETASTAPAAAPTAPAAAPTAGGLPSASTAAPSTSNPGTAFTAYGVKVAWRATVSDGVLTTEGPIAGERKVTVERSAFARGVDFTGVDGKTPVALTVKSGTCLDDGGDTGMEAILTVGDRQLGGCAVEGVIPHADT